MTTNNYSIDFLTPLDAKRTLENVYNKKLKCPALFRYIIDEIAIIKMPTKDRWDERESHWCYNKGLYLVSYHVKMRPSKNHCQTRRKITPPMIEKQIRALHAKLSDKERKIGFTYVTDWEEERYSLYGHESYYSVKLLDPAGGEMPLDSYECSVQMLIDMQITKNGLWRRISAKGVIEHGVFNLRSAEIVSELGREWAD